MIAKNWEGKIEAMWAFSEEKLGDIITATAEVARFALIKAKEEKWTKIEIQGRCLMFSKSSNLGIQMMSKLH